MFSNAPYPIEVGAWTATGRRKENQDKLAHFNTPLGYVVLVADGMGGYKGGSMAASLVTSRLQQALGAASPSISPESALTDAVTAVNQEIREIADKGGDEMYGMGSTLAALLVRNAAEGPLAIAANVGDSRIYFLRGQRLFRVTRDHTMVQQLVETGTLTDTQAFHHPRANVLTRALGHGEALEVEFSSWMLLKPGDLFLLCSDGLSGYVRDREFLPVLFDSHNPQQLATRLVEFALEHGSEDNVSVATVRVNGMASI